MSSSDPEQEELAADAGLLNLRMRSSFLWLGSSTALKQGISWILTLVTARVLMPSDYGIMALIGAVIPYLSTLSALGVGAWYVQTPSVSPRLREELFGLTIVIGLLTLAIGLVLAPVTSSLFEIPELFGPFCLMAIVLCVRSIAALPNAMIRRDMRFQVQAIAEFVCGVTQSVLTLVLALLGFGYWALVLGTVFNQITLSLWYICSAGLPNRIGWNWKRNKEVLRFGVLLSGAGIFWILFTTIDDAIVGKLLGAEVLGFYAMAYMLTELPVAKLNAVLNPILESYFSKVKGDPEEFNRSFLKLTRTFTGLLAPVYVGLIVAAPEGVAVVLGEKWLPVVDPLRAMAVAGFLRASTASIAAASSALGNARDVLKYSVVNSVLLVPSFFVFAYYFGLGGVLFSWTGIYAVATFLNIRIFGKSVAISSVDYVMNLAVPVSGSLLMGAAMLLFKSYLDIGGISIQSDLLSLLLQIFAGILFFFLFISFFAPRYRDESLALIRRRAA